MARITAAGTTAIPRRTNHARRNATGCAASSPRCDASHVITGAVQIAASGTCRIETYRHHDQRDAAGDPEQRPGPGHVLPSRVSGPADNGERDRDEGQHDRRPGVALQAGWGPFHDVASIRAVRELGQHVPPQPWTEWVEECGDRARRQRHPQPPRSRAKTSWTPTRAGQVLGGAQQDGETDGTKAGDEATVQVGPRDHHDRQDPQRRPAPQEKREEHRDVEREKREGEQLGAEEEESTERRCRQQKDRNPDQRLARRHANRDEQRSQRHAADQALQSDETEWTGEMVRGPQQQLGTVLKRRPSRGGRCIGERIV